MKSLPLKYGNTIPQLGLGTWQLLGDECVESVKNAIQLGINHIDTADRYGNHKQVGLGIKESGVKREDLFVTSKVWIENFGYEDTKKSCERNLKELELDYLDLYLMHWPNSSVPIEETLKALLELKQEGKIKSFGVSNFTINHLKDALAITNEVEVNQVEFHPTLNQKELKRFCDENKIVLEAYSPMALGKEPKLSEIIGIAEKYNTSPHQVIINWIIRQGIVCLSKSTKREHLEDNLKALNLELSTEDLAVLDNLNRDYRSVNPDFNEFDY